MLASRVRRCLAVALLASGPVRAEPEPCAAAARFSPCFDADPLWLSAGPSDFAALHTARVLPGGELSTELGLGYAHRPVILVAPSPHLYGREIPVVEDTSTLTLGARYGVGYGIDVGVALPFVPYQNGTGVEGVTTQDGSGLSPTVLRDPRLELGATLVGERPHRPFALGTRLVLALPLGAASALAGAAGPTVAPGFAASLELGRFTLAADVSLRFRRGVDFANTRQGSEANFAAGVGFDLVRAGAELGIGVEAWVRPKLTSAPPGTAEGTRDLPAEWLGSVHFSPEQNGAWSFLAGAGTGLPLSYAAEPAAPSEATLGVTAPELRAVLRAARAFR